MAVVGNIKKWVKIVNAEYGLSDKNKASIDYFVKLKDIAKFEFNENDYLIYMTSTDMWGDKFLSVISYYILPEHRNYKSFIKMQRRIEELAKINNVKYIYQGSHLNSKLSNVLSKMGYSVGYYKKEIF